MKYNLNGSAFKNERSSKFRGLLTSITDGKQVFNFPLDGASGIGVMQRNLKQAIETGIPLNRTE
ncbi:hypothetical protein FKY06_01010 [Listeria monocytogenes]|nr:hypothetical protein [Listeria monocytogenes]EBH4250691.1 hypothetical protein [Listeria monocytogenes]